MTIRRTLVILAIALGVAAPAVAWADDYVGPTTTTATTATTRPSSTTTTVIEGTSITASSTSSTIAGSVITQPSVLGGQITRPPAVSGLALTGTDILGITAFAAALLAAGLGLVIRARRLPTA